MLGTLDRWNADRGFGFISPDGNPSDSIMLHIYVLKRAGYDTIRIGDRFEVKTTDNLGRLKATDVNLVARGGGAVIDLSVRHGDAQTMTHMSRHRQERVQWPSGW